MAGDFKKVIMDYLSTCHGIAAVFLFGSRAKSGRSNRHSDVDLAILFVHNQKPEIDVLFKMRDDLFDKLGTEVDLVNLNDADPIISMQVLQGGEALFVPNQRVYDEWIMRLLTDYSDLKDIRQQGEEQLLKGLKND